MHRFIQVLQIEKSLRWSCSHSSVNTHASSRGPWSTVKLLQTQVRSPSASLQPVPASYGSRSRVTSFEILSVAKGNSCSCTALAKLAYCSNYISPRAGILLTLHCWQTPNQNCGSSLALANKAPKPPAYFPPASINKACQQEELAWNIHLLCNENN